MSNYTAEETRALAFNLSREQRAIACKAREFSLGGNAGALRGLQLRTQARANEESNEQRNKVRYNENLEAFCDESNLTVSG